MSWIIHSYFFGGIGQTWLEEERIAVIGGHAPRIPWLVRAVHGWLTATQRERERERERERDERPRQQEIGGRRWRALHARWLANEPVPAVSPHTPHTPAHQLVPNAAHTNGDDWRHRKTCSLSAHMAGPAGGAGVSTHLLRAVRATYPAPPPPCRLLRPPPPLGPDACETSW